MQMIKKHIDFYNKYIQTGMLPDQGLCCCALSGIIDRQLLKIMEPTDNDYKDLRAEEISTVYWACGLPANLDDHEKKWPFTPLRQTVILFMAAMNGEL